MTRRRSPAVMLRFALVSLALVGCTSTLPRSGLPCPASAYPQTAKDDDGSREWCEIPSYEKNCAVYSGDCTVPGTGHGPWIKYWPNGLRKEQAEVDHGKIHGTQLHFYESGKLQMQTEWKNYRREGWETRWHENGSVEWRGLYRDNRRDGEWSAWFSNGHAAFRGSYAMNDPIGAWTFWNEDGSVSRVHSFVDVPTPGQDPKLPNGRTTVRGFEGLPVRSESMVDGVRHGSVWNFDEQGVLKSVDVYDHGTMVSSWMRTELR